jgi:hypothetical protein
MLEVTPRDFMRMIRGAIAWNSPNPLVEAAPPLICQEKVGYIGLGVILSGCPDTANSHY